MPAFYAVDSHRKRIKTDVLVSGYIRNTARDHGLLIPDGINTICFEYWIVRVCDVWDQEFSSKLIKIKEDKVRAGDCVWPQSIYGSHSVRTGSHSWSIRFKTNVKWFCIGIIYDDPEILKQYQDNNGYKKTDNGCCLFNGGYFWRNDQSIYGHSETHYSDSFFARDTVIIMTLVQIQLDIHPYHNHTSSLT